CLVVGALFRQNGVVGEARVDCIQDGDVGQLVAIRPQGIHRQGPLPQRNEQVAGTGRDAACLAVLGVGYGGHRAYWNAGMTSLAKSCIAVMTRSCGMPPKLNTAARVSNSKCLAAFRMPWMHCSGLP